jgi:ABC-type transporter Mla MlaB component
MHETHTEVTRDGVRAPAREPEQAAVDALTVLSEHRLERDVDVLVLWLSGTLNKATSDRLDGEFDTHAGHATHVVFDLSGLELIDCAGLETLVGTHRRAAENDQRTSFRQGPHAGLLPPELTHDPHPRFQPVAHRVNESISENLLRARQAGRADVDHQRPLVIDPETPGTSFD